MLQATLRDAFGQEMRLLGDAQLGFWPMEDIGDAASAAAGAIQSAAGAAADVVKGAASLACNVIQNPIVQTGARYAAMVPSGYTQGTAAGVKAGATACSAANPPKPPASTTTSTKITAAEFLAKFRPAMKPTVGVKDTSVKTPVAVYPAGAFQWRRAKTGMWVIAAPKAAGLGGAPELTTPYVHTDLKHLYRRRGNWYDVHTADRPYLATWGLAGDAVVVGEQPAQAPGVPVVSEDEGKKRTSAPIYKTWWFWALVGGGTLALGGTATYLVRKRRRG